MTMDLNKSRDRLEWARDDLSYLKKATNFRQFERAWNDFLTHANGAFVQLEVACKCSEQTRQWYAGQKQRRQDDQLMQYLHEARNADEHSVEKVTQFHPGSVMIGKQAEGYSNEISFSQGPDGRMDVQSLDGKPVLIEVRKPEVRLRPVTVKRGGKVYGPPKSHLGASLEDTSPIAIAEKAVEFISGVLAEAEAKFAYTMARKTHSRT
ncbi:hypothetical protein [Seohaeicola zhoushanensis]|uniref:Uncharacterized protein n=1 Tax=Seohaeicola zhoushanensis TaxID=1569283 RepID=A0A8J3GT03_9RHOB|nr:hypothetical protein [Seohaeicola zhoushanensis]GHF33281.1 hypothetical protein GCM10017056_00870 [Seohaeicola zhoushanensis]